MLGKTTLFSHGQGKFEHPSRYSFNHLVMLPKSNTNVASTRQNTEQTTTGRSKTHEEETSTREGGKGGGGEGGEIVEELF